MLGKYLGASLAIAMMWLAVLFVGIYGPTFEVNSAGGDEISIPTGLALAPFAMVGTIIVGIFGFRESCSVRRPDIGRGPDFTAHPPISSGRMP